MYLHELGEEAASFTKEEMQQGWVLLFYVMPISLFATVLVNVKLNLQKQCLN